MNQSSQPGASYVACVPHVPHLSIQERSWHPELWDAYDARVREFNAFDPELVVVFGGDHYSGIHLKLSPTFIIGQIAEAIDDCGGTPGALDIPRDTAIACAADLVEHGFDIATSYAMEVDHGFSNILGFFMDGNVAARPVLPIHINSLTYPRPTLKRCRELGEAVGRFVASLGKRVAFLGSGGLSHQTDFIFPQYDTAPSEDVRHYIVHGGGGAITREKWLGDIDSGMKEYAVEIHEGRFKPYINCAWDKRFLDVFGAGDLSKFDDWRDQDILEEAGYGGGEVRMWIAAAAAGQEAGAAAPVVDYYSETTHLAVGAAIAHSLKSAA